MARSNSIKFFRGTRAALNALAAANGLIAGEPYWITDEDVLAVGKSANDYQDFSKKIITVSNANGRYTRFPDGTQICWANAVGVDHVANTMLTWYWTFPASFQSTTDLIVEAGLHSVASTNGFSTTFIQSLANSISDGRVQSQFSATQNYRFWLKATGRWLP